MEKTKILFVCHGNICRSPMAERVMKHLVDEAGLADFFEISSAAMHTDAIGCRMYRPAIRELESHSISGDGHTAKLMTSADYGHYDLIVGMDNENKRDFLLFTHGDPDGKFSLLMSHAGVERDVADPWYTGDFSKTYEDVLAGCKKILEKFK
jgi:protein-tyrosine phosphatase